MSDLVQVALITAAPGFLLALVSLIKIFIVEKKVEAVHLDVNSKVTKLLEVDGDAREAVGKLKGEKLARETQWKQEGK